MKQYTTPEQTAKLIELGFEKPKMAAPKLEWENGEPKFVPQYTIGELIEMLPQYLDYNGGVADMPIDYYALTIRQNIVMYCDPYMDWIEEQCKDHDELIDNLLDMIIKLKEEKLI